MKKTKLTVKDLLEKKGKQKLVIKESLNINFKEISKTSIILSF